LDQDHVASHQTCGVCTASRIGLAPKYDNAIAVRGVSEDFVEVHCESVQVANVQRTKVGVESIVEEGVINGEVYGTLALGGY
jgi:hypothetical protein